MIFITVYVLFTSKVTIPIHCIWIADFILITQFSIIIWFDYSYLRKTKHLDNRIFLTVHQITFVTFTFTLIMNNGTSIVHTRTYKWISWKVGYSHFTQNTFIEIHYNIYFLYVTLVLEWSSFGSYMYISLKN